LSSSTGGALADLDAWDVHPAKLYGRCVPTTASEPFGRLVGQVMTARPHRDALWVLDNGSSHRGASMSSA
jgi:hypothetical protein